MFIAFEGIDGSGKTTLSNRLAARLRARGFKVTHAREKGELQSAVARRVRELTRDASLMDMSPEAELMLNLARDAQQRREIIEPSLARGEICIADRYLHSPLTLACSGRGLDPAGVEPAVQLAAAGVWPDLVILVDADPELARLRKRASKLSDPANFGKASSRKGLAGSGLATRMRLGYLALADRDPSRWHVLTNDGSSLDALLEELCQAVLARLQHRPMRPAFHARKAPVVGSVPSRMVAATFLNRIDELMVREPPLAALLLGGLRGTEIHRRRMELVDRQPDLIALSLSGLQDDDAFALRSYLRERAPEAVARSLTDVSSPLALQLLEELMGRARREALAALRGNASSAAWLLRLREVEAGQLPQVLPSLAGICSAQAQSLREQGMAEGLYGPVARSLRGVPGPEADGLRQSLWPKERLSILESVQGLDSPFARRAREQLYAVAPKAVLRSLCGVSTPYADQLRQRAAPLTKEALDSVDGLDTAAAWELREQHLDLWPSTAVSSLIGLHDSPRRTALLERALKRHGDRITVLRNALRVMGAPVGAGALGDRGEPLTVSSMANTATGESA